MAHKPDESPNGSVRTDAGARTVWVGHVHVKSPDVAATYTSMQKLGMRPIFAGDAVGVLELRGGIHLVVTPREAVEHPV